MDVPRVKSVLESAIESVRSRPVLATFIDRVFLLDDADLRLAGTPQARRPGEAMNFVVERLSLPIVPGVTICARSGRKLLDSKPVGR